MRFAAVLLLLLAACSRGISSGSVVALDYELLSADGAVIEKSPAGEPLVLTLGEGRLPAAVERALDGKRVGDALIVSLSVEQAFGPRDPAKIRRMPLSSFGAMAKDVKPGRVVAGSEAGRAAEGRVIRVEKGDVELDFNHPLAGRALEYRLRVLGVD